MVSRMALQIACVAGVLGAGPAWAADAPTTAETLQKVHASNQKEVAMGKQAIDRASSADVKALGRMLVKDHTAADKKVAKLAKDEGITLSDTSSTTDTDMLPVGDGYDAAFAKMMVDDHARDIADVTAARDGTSDAKLKRLLTDMLPTLKKHEDRAQRIVDRANKS